jgi:hypothetical protein
LRLDDKKESDKGNQELARLSMLEKNKQRGATVRMSCSTAANYNPIYLSDQLSHRANDVTFAIDQVAAHQSAPRT